MNENEDEQDEEVSKGHTSIIFSGNFIHLQNDMCFTIYSSDIFTILFHTLVIYIISPLYHVFLGVNVIIFSQREAQLVNVFLTEEHYWNKLDHSFFFILHFHISQIYICS